MGFCWPSVLHEDDTFIGRVPWFPTHVVRCADAIHPIDEDLSMGTPGMGQPFSW